MLSSSQPFFGAIPSQGGVGFRVWAPAAREATVVLHDGAAQGNHPLARGADGIFDTWVRGAAAGDSYGYLLEGSGPFPDPASRYQPQGVHGPSQVVDPTVYQWTDVRWRPRLLLDLIIYELHVGTFTRQGTFSAARDRLPYLRDLGVTAIELMPVADFPGARNWGYDGTALFAPSRAYGSPDDLRQLVDAAHAHGLIVLLDVVYSHLGPDGAYVAHFSPQYLAKDRPSPWGSAVNLDGPGASVVRRFIIDNALHWIREYHVDGLRFDATHAFADRTEPHLLQDLVQSIRSSTPRPVILHAEDNRNEARLVEDPSDGGWGLDGVWADDFHHVLRRMIAGDSDGYFADYAGTTRELAEILCRGWLYSGQLSPHTGQARGTAPDRVPLNRFIVCLQNHDQIGNRALADRMHATIAPERWRAASVLLFTSPMTPLVFMGQEWAASTPFNYFTDHDAELGRRVTEGRRAEFGSFAAFSEPGATARIADPQAESTFEGSRLRWDEMDLPDHARALALYRQLLVLRREHPALAASDLRLGEAVAPDDQSIVVRRSESGETFWIVARLRSGGEIDLTDAASALGHPLDGGLALVLDTEHAEFTADPQAIDLFGAVVRFRRPGAIILRG